MRQLQAELDASAEARIALAAVWFSLGSVWAVGTVQARQSHFEPVRMTILEQ